MAPLQQRQQAAQTDQTDQTNQTNFPSPPPPPLSPAAIGDESYYSADHSQAFAIPAAPTPAASPTPSLSLPPPPPPPPVPANLLDLPGPSERPDTAPSHSSSFEADDERSATGPPSATTTDRLPMRRSPRRSISDSSNDAFPMAGHRPSARLGAAVRRRGRQSESAAYAGEDTRPTSSREILGWYMYSFASETYVICAIASFIPILLESLARENGVLLSDRTTPCNAPPATSPASPVSASAAASACVVYVLGLEINTASFAMYTFSISVLLQALLVVSISCAADHGNYRKTLLLVFAAAGSIAVMLFLFVSARTYLLGALLAIISNTSFGASFVLLNSFLPLLVRHHPTILDSDATGDMEPALMSSADEPDDGVSADSVADPDDSTTALLPSSRSRSLSPTTSGSASSNFAAASAHEEQTSAELALSTQLSARGVSIGYCAALFVQCIAIAVVFHMHSTVWSQRVALFFIGAWWAVFSIPTALWLRPRPGPPLPGTAGGAQPGPGARGMGRLAAYARSWGAYLFFAWTSLFRTIALARRLRDIALFLAGWFLLSDAIATTSSTAVLFAKTQLHMEVWALGLISVISTMTGVAGALGWAAISRRVPLMRANPLNTILACLALFELIPLYGLLGYVPLVRRWGIGGLQKPWEMYALASVYGFVLGGFSSHCRSLYGELIPPGSEAAFYALYAITDKGSSVFGPAIVGAIIDATGEIRPAFWFLAALVGLPAPLLYFVDVERGRRDGEALAAVIEGFRPARGGSSAATSGHDEGNRDEEESGSAHTPRAILADYDDDDEPMVV